MASHSNPRSEEPAGMAPPPDNAENDNYSDVEIPSPSHDGSDCESPEMPAQLSEMSVEEFFRPIVERTRYRMHPMQEALTVPWEVPVSAADVERLRVGFRSRSMDDKWDLLLEDPDDKGGWSMHIIRTFGAIYDTCFVLHLVHSQQPGTGTKTTSFTWDTEFSHHHVPEEQAKKDAIMLFRGHLGCEFEALPQYTWATEFWRNRRKLDEAYSGCKNESRY
ncbi:hypothetical protein GGTG_13142 [Gaeumannomyces tritici R3-111a-1]|uniref:Uncharacterized protein n=1 Tax=Gaeumannomyces tritici (strain R3-111a-1) TaxID=644352 RepID=J3PI11_GAET3|nr:hypothetical protein GGTG_13142 [Gaeumannomyces tritici R3-111a-1]EJT69523.1 hypothetical protein GGTG_13142 [Gaeumannomyces tritici R3-111a-1]